MSINIGALAVGLYPLCWGLCFKRSGPYAALTRRVTCYRVTIGPLRAIYLKDAGAIA